MPEVGLAGKYLMRKGKDNRSDGFREMARNRTSKHDSIDSIRTRYWYAMLEMETGLQSAYAMERWFEPDAFGVGEKSSKRYHRNKWASYRNGKRTPRTALIEQVDGRQLGSARLINHVLWRTLRVSEEVRSHIGPWISELEPSIQSLIHRKAAASPVSAKQRRRVDARLIGIIGRHASLDSLACLTMLLREAWETGNSSVAFHAVVPTLNVLIAHCCARPMFDLAEELYEIYKRDVFSLVIDDNMKYDFERYNFPQVVKIIHGILLRWQSEECREFDWNESLKLKLDILRGRYKLELGMMLRPHIIKCS